MYNIPLQIMSPGMHVNTFILMDVTACLILPTTQCLFAAASLGRNDNTQHFYSFPHIAIYKCFFVQLSLIKHTGFT